MVSILILRLDDEGDFPGCLRSVAWSDDVVVLDTCGGREAVAAAEAAGARQILPPAEPPQDWQDWALGAIPYRHEWVFCLDAGESVSDVLRAEILSITADSTNRAKAFTVRRENYLIGTPLRHAMPADAAVRLVKTGPAGSQPAAASHRERCPQLRERLHRDPFANGLRAWLTQHNELSQAEALREARARAVIIAAEAPAEPSQDVTGPRPQVNPHQSFSIYVRRRGLWRFLYTYFLRLGFLDGVSGLDYAVMLGTFGNWTKLKFRELESPWRARTDKLVERLLKEPHT